MSATPRSLILVAYAPALTVDDSRPLGVVHGMERALRSLRLEWRIDETGRPIALPRRDSWLEEAAARGRFPLLCNGDENHPVTVFGSGRPAGISPGNTPQLEVHAELPMDPIGISASAQLLEQIAHGAHSFWGRILPDGMGATMALQVRHPSDEPRVPPRGLPVLKLPEEILSPEIPHHLGWLNYWSAATARTLGFPDPARDAELLSRARRTSTGGWIVQLTDAPLDLDDPSHLEALLRAYERFPAIGGRASP
ncbi:hypothetical protein D7X74_32990 [Corallococcus sp. CA047B]|uniref:DUF5953 family protein n=1 Tax=Corallococcus sp. CA047B TaxID=2316729 RepID=UPI000EA34761|nr:DUF5953 family protein [Corallococcus sp. CA047B]RKH07433.1 hypothetical protein D7X74_32990 [Corallococcus sp. CA047B]